MKMHGQIDDIFAILDKKGNDEGEDLEIKINDWDTVFIENEDSETDSSINES